MGILKKISLTWKTMTTAEKIGMVIDIVCGAGAGVGSMIAGAKLGAGRSKIEKVCISTCTAGLGLAAADVSSQALKENYGNLAAALIDRAKEKTKEAAKEAAENE